MKTKTLYEWDIEEFDPNTGDILDHSHSDECPGIPQEDGFRLVLIREVWSVCPHDGEIFDLQERSWAYVENGKLPEETDDGYRVPNKYHTELSSTL